MRERPKAPPKTCACCLMPDNMGVSVVNYEVLTRLPETPIAQTRGPRDYCDLCARHILSLGVLLKKEDSR